MEYVAHVLNPDLGPVVEITIGLSFAEEEVRRAAGTETSPRRSIFALIDPGLGTTVISEKIRAEFDPGGYELRPEFLPWAGTALRVGTSLYIGAPELLPDLLERNIRVVVVPLPDTVQCILGRNFLVGIEFVYEGALESFGWRVSPFWESS